MALLTIRTVPDPFLRKKARKIAKITPKHKKLAGDMIETMNEHNGVGLAANQVGQLERMAVVQTPDMEEAMVLVNPEIVRKEGEREVEEGCSAFPATGAGCCAPRGSGPRRWAWTPSPSGSMPRNCWRRRWNTK